MTERMFATCILCVRFLLTPDRPLPSPAERSLFTGWTKNVGVSQESGGQYG